MLDAGSDGSSVVNLERGNARWKRCRPCQIITRCQRRRALMANSVGRNTGRRMRLELVEVDVSSLEASELPNSGSDLLAHRIRVGPVGEVDQGSDAGVISADDSSERDVDARTVRQ